METKPYSDFLSLCKSPHTQYNYHQDLRVLKDFLDRSGLDDPIQAKPVDLSRFVGQLAKPGQTPTGKPRPSYSTRSMKRILASTRSFYRYLASAQMITADPTAIFHNMAIRSPQRNPRPLSPNDRKSLVQNLKYDTLEELKISLTVLLGYHCGLRVSEIAKMRFKDIDMDLGWITVIGKGDKERRVPMTESLKKTMTAFLAKKESGVYFFPSPRNSNLPIHIRYLETWVKTAAKRANFNDPEDLTVHVLRHSFGTQLAESGASAYEIRDLMGHSSIAVSENYVKLASTRARQAHEKAFGNALILPNDFGLLLRHFRKISRRGI